MQGEKSIADIPLEVFIASLEAEWEAIPEAWKSKLKNVTLLWEDVVSEELKSLEKLEGGDTLLGLYQGIPNTLRDESYTGVLPDTITLFRIPILEEALDSKKENETVEAALRRVIRETIWHEVGHYFGLDEEPLHKREEEGTNRFEH